MFIFLIFPKMDKQIMLLTVGVFVFCLTFFKKTEGGCIMARQIFCPECQCETDCISKGFTKNRKKKIVMCKECGKRFQIELDEWEVAGGGSTEKSSNKKSKNQIVTKIMVNGNVIKTINDKLEKEDAIALASEYFRGISENNCEIDTNGNEVVYKFTIIIGEKG